MSRFDFSVTSTEKTIDVQRGETVSGSVSVWMGTRSPTTEGGRLGYD